VITKFKFGAAGISRWPTGASARSVGAHGSVCRQTKWESRWKILSGELGRLRLGGMECRAVPFF
jgi:hypothetical protein